MGAIINFSNYLDEHTTSLANQIVAEVIVRIDSEVPPEEREQAVDMYKVFLRFLADMLNDAQQQTVPAELIEWSRNNAEMIVSLNVCISRIIDRYPPTRDVFIEVFTELSVDHGLSVRENAFIIKCINNLLDVSLSETFSAFERLSNKLNEDTQNELVKLSAPIVPITDDVVVIPLIGYLDEKRVRHMMENVIPKVAEMDIDHVITDFSGIVTINEQIAEAMHQIGNMLRLMGIHVIAAGLRPDLAQAVVSSGINMSEIESYATVKQALKSIR